MRIFVYLAFVVFVEHAVSQTDLSNEQVKKSITWSIIPVAPVHILKGEFKGQGIADQYIHNAQLEMPGYSHHNQIMTPARAWYLITQGNELVCHPSALKTSNREAVAYFSVAVLITPVIRVLMRKIDWQERLKGANELKIEDYINANNGIFGIVSQRSYGGEIDQILATSIASGKQIIQTSGENGSRQLYEMLVKGRIDMMMEYPWVSSYFKKISYNQEVDVVHLKISDFPKFTPAYVACTRNQAGKDAIEMLNRYLRKAVLEPENRKRMMNWLDDKEAASYEQDYLEYFKIAH